MVNLQIEDQYTFLNITEQDQEYAIYINQHGTFDESVYCTVNNGKQRVVATKDVPEIVHILASVAYEGVRKE